MAKVLVNIDLSEGLADSVDVEVGGLEYTQTLDYVNVSFRCVKCHAWGHAVEDCSKGFACIIWQKIDGASFNPKVLRSRNPSIASQVVGFVGKMALDPKANLESSSVQRSSGTEVVQAGT